MNRTVRFGRGYDTRDGRGQENFLVIIVIGRWVVCVGEATAFAWLAQSQANEQRPAEQCIPCIWHTFSGHPRQAQSDRGFIGLQSGCVLNSEACSRRLFFHTAVIVISWIGSPIKSGMTGVLCSGGVPSRCDGRLKWAPFLVRLANKGTCKEEAMEPYLACFCLRHLPTLKRSSPASAA